MLVIAGSSLRQTCRHRILMVSRTDQMKGQLIGFVFVLFFWAALEFVGAPRFLWVLIAIVVAILLTTGTKADPGSLFVLAALGFTTVVFLANSEAASISANRTVGMLCLAAGAPLGVASFRALRGRPGRSRPIEFAAGIVIGALGAAIVPLILVRILIPLSRIPKVEFLELGDYFPPADTLRQLECTATGSHAWQCSNLARTLGFVYHTLQSVLAVYWDLLVTGAVVLALSAVGNKIVPDKRSR
jgi:hypothetical protein